MANARPSQVHLAHLVHFDLKVAVIDLIDALCFLDHIFFELDFLVLCGEFNFVAGHVYLFQSLFESKLDHD